MRLVDVAQAQYNINPRWVDLVVGTVVLGAVLLSQKRVGKGRRHEIAATDLVKVFPGVRALDGVTLDLRPGTVHALLGENGAGKSTLIKVLTGVYRADGGACSWARATPSDRGPVPGPHDAQAAGIGVVHQERNLVPAFSVAENIALQALPSRRGLLDGPRCAGWPASASAQLEVDLDLDRPVAELSVAHMQLVEIAKALATDSQILLLDEPTASLTGRRGRSPVCRACGGCATRGVVVVLRQSQAGGGLCRRGHRHRPA